MQSAKEIIEIRMKSTVINKGKELGATIGCKTRETLQNFGIFFMNFALEQKKISRLHQFTPAPRINVDHSFRHYGHFVSGQHCAGGRGDVLPGIGIFQNWPKTGQVSHQFCNRLLVESNQSQRRDKGTG